ncbi:LysM peptidoglycan-binding domain-containing protein [Microbacterium sp.]|uniref:LysM peptidoglycan-binding domain-containing protein n=1 Tax=Microbacterium sp. TaxID=51671 RepID=UPI003C78A425
MTTIDTLGTPRALGSLPRFTVADGARTSATRLRLTRRGRRVLAFLASIPAIVALSIAIVSGGGAIASDEGGAGATFAYVTVMPGESLWSIAETVAPRADPRDAVDAIMRLNALPSGNLVAGQAIAIPAEYGAAH